MAGRKPASIIVPPPSETTHYSMSRHSTPSSAIGRLDLLNSSSSSSSGMPVETRSSRKKRGEQENRQTASSGRGSRTPAVTAGPSRSSTTRATPYTGLQTGSRRQTQSTSATYAEDEDEEEDGDDDGDGDDEDDEPGDEPAGGVQGYDEPLLTVCEHLCAHTLGCLTPLEFYELEPNPNGGHNKQLRYNAAQISGNQHLAAHFGHYSRFVPQDHCLSSMVERLPDRWNRIVNDLAAFVVDKQKGANVAQTISATRQLFSATGAFLTHYIGEETLDEDDTVTLADLLSKILWWLQKQDKSVFADTGMAQAPYSNPITFNPYLAFIHPTGQPIVFMQVLDRLPDAVLQEENLRNGIDHFFRKAVEKGLNPNFGWVRVLYQVHYRSRL